MITHPIPPIYNENSRILILGSFPSVRSREEGFFYGHPQNRFWRVVASVFGKSIPQTTDEKKEMLYDCGIALWDVISVCDIDGSADNSIKNVVPNDISRITKAANIEKIFLNGKTAEKYYIKFIGNSVATETVCLPSTSPANASWTLEKLIQKWSIIRT